MTTYTESSTEQNNIQLDYSSTVNQLGNFLQTISGVLFVVLMIGIFLALSWFEHSYLTLLSFPTFMCWLISGILLLASTYLMTVNAGNMLKGNKRAMVAGVVLLVLTYGTRFYISNDIAEAFVEAIKLETGVLKPIKGYKVIYTFLNIFGITVETMFALSFANFTKTKV